MVVLLILVVCGLAACGDLNSDTNTKTLTFKNATVRKSKLLVSTNRNANGNTTQRFTNTLRANGTALSSAVLGNTIYVIGGSKQTGGLQNDVWKSTDGGATWVNVHKN